MRGKLKLDESCISNPEILPSSAEEGSISGFEMQYSSNFEISAAKRPHYLTCTWNWRIYLTFELLRKIALGINA